MNAENQEFSRKIVPSLDSAKGGVRLPSPERRSGSHARQRPENGGSIMLETIATIVAVGWGAAFAAVVAIPPAMAILAIVDARRGAK